MPLSAEDIEKGRLEQFPTAMGAIVLTVKVPGIEDKQLNPTGPLVAAIFMGKVSRWNDRRIAELNPGVNLPNLPFAPVHRADASGTTFQFTDYLAKVSEEWKSRVGVGTSVRWPAGISAHGNDGVAGAVRNTGGDRLRRVCLREAEPARFHPAAEPRRQLRRAEQGVVPGRGGQRRLVLCPPFRHFAERPARQGQLADHRPTFILVPLHAADPQRTRNVLRFFEWAFRNGDSITEELVFITLPDSTKNTIRQMWAAKFNFRSE